ncbi:unnamed protein product [Aureobasidium pullulans]|nr:unnamed protein product [Aureobasidium pullulans]
MAVPLPPQWVVDLTSPPTAKPKASSIPDPPGYTAPTTVSNSKSSKTAVAQAPARKPPNAQEMDTLKLKKAWEMAIAPAKQLPMNAFGMYMSGNSLQIFSIMMVFMLFKGPIQALINIQNVFARFETEGTRDRLILVKLAYVACNFLALALGIWKVNGMGLLPYVSQPYLRYPYIANNQSGTTRSDWLAWETAREPLARVYPSSTL